ncbi:alpha/beta-hydrolase [Atractiella rhizophila]|nr:alpha/beta-hydrolase [Atractiella rhizophila]
MHSIRAVSLVSFILGVISAPTTQQHQAANCNSFYFEVEATYERFDIDLTLPTTQAEAQKLLEDIFGGVINPVTGSENTTATFTHFGKFCYPPAYTAAKNPDTIQVLVHAAWEVEAEYEIAYQPEKYNYIDYATSQGYTVFAYDRLGLGKSQSIDGREVQAPLNTEILTQIVTKLKDGSFGHGQQRKYDRVVLMGHSMGSAIVNGLLAKSPDLVEAAVLLGYGHNVNPAFISAIDVTVPALASPTVNWPSSYVAIPNLAAKLAGFYAPKGTYDPKLAAATFAVPAPAGLGEMVTMPHVLVTAEDFKGHAAIFNGDHDFAFCPNGVCNGEASMAGEAAFFPNADFTVKIFKDTGHGTLNHYSSKEVQEAIIDYFNDAL